MLELARTVRFCLSDTPAGGPRHNAFSAYPPPRGLARYYELEVRCVGEADPATGYFINIKEIDEAVRGLALPRFQAALAEHASDADVPLGALLAGVLGVLQEPLNRTIDRLTLRLTPRISLTLLSRAMHEVVTRQRYEFSAAHRLHVPGRSDAENRAIFGKCNNPAGHGHNYVVEVAVRSPIDPAGHSLDIAALDAVVDQHAIELLDHKHLNLDVPQFRTLNPSVEHIAQVIWGMLQSPITTLGPGVTLDELSVWETGKTVCTYRG